MISISDLSKLDTLLHKTHRGMENVGRMGGWIKFKKGGVFIKKMGQEVSVNFII